MAVSNFTAQVAPMGHVAKVALQEQEAAVIKQQTVQRLLPGQLAKDGEKVEKTAAGSSGQKVRRNLEERQRHFAGQEPEAERPERHAQAGEAPGPEAGLGGDVWSGNIVNVKV